jgi:P22 tail accessory factor
MPTVLDVTSRALRLIGALAESENPTAAQSDDAIKALQAMLGEWETRGVKVGAVVDQSPVTAATVLALPITHMNAITLNLAVLLAAEYGAAQAMQMVLPQAERSFDALLAAYVRPSAAPIDAALVGQYINLTWSEPYWWTEA